MAELVHPPRHQAPLASSPAGTVLTEGQARARLQCHLRTSGYHQQN